MVPRWLLLLMLVGCAPSDQGMVGSKMEAGGQGVACRPQEGQVCVDRVGGTVVDLQGNALAGKVVTVCGIMCFAGTTDEDGTFSVQVGAPLRSGEYALSVYGRPDHGSLYLQLPVLTREVFLSSAVELPALPPGGPVLPPDGTPASSITSGPLTLSFANGTAFELDIDDMVRGEEGRRLRVAVVAPAKATFVSHAVWLLALAPFGARLSIPAAVEIVGTQGLSEGQRVEFWFLEDDLLAQGGNRAGLGAVAAEGRVEGGKIRSDPGQGLTKLTWLAVRPK